MNSPRLFLFVLTSLFSGLVTPAYAIGNKTENKASETTKIDSLLDQEIAATKKLLDANNEGCVNSIKAAEEILSKMKFQNYSDEAISRLSLAAIGCSVANSEFDSAIRLVDFGLQYSEGELRDYMIIGAILSTYFTEDDKKLYEYIQELNAENADAIKLINPIIWRGIIQAGYQTATPVKNNYIVLKKLYEADFPEFSESERIDFTNNYIYYDALQDPEDSELKELIFKITSMELYLGFLVDKRFDFIRKFENYNDFANIDKQVSRQEDFLNAKIKDNPKELGLVNKLSRIKRYTGKNGDALVMLEKTLEKSKSEPDYFFDTEEELNWMFEEKSKALMAQGQVKEGLAVISKAVSIKEIGNENISQAINYASYSIDYGYYKEALAKLKKATEKRSKFADGLVISLEACARFKLKDKNFNLEKTEKELSSFSEVNIGYSLVNFYSCMGDVDNTSKSIIKLLEDPTTRAYTLVYISGTFSPGEYRAEQRRQQSITIIEAIKNEEVMKAINKYGYIITIPLDKNLIGF